MYYLKILYNDFNDYDEEVYLFKLFAFCNYFTLKGKAICGFTNIKKLILTKDNCNILAYFENG